MKKIIPTILIGIIGMNLSAQEIAPAKKERKKKHTIVRPASCPRAYITTSTGVNNNTGLLGFSFDIPVSKNVAIDAGTGQDNVWGDKIYAGIKYYLSPCLRGFAFGVGLTYDPGKRYYEHNFETIYGNTETEQFILNPSANLIFAGYKYWNLGRKYNRVFVELGWSVRLSTTDKSVQVSGDPITSSSANALNSNTPGGLIAAVGFSFGLR